MSQAADRWRRRLGTLPLAGHFRAWWQRQPSLYHRLGAWLQTWSFDGLRDSRVRPTGDERIAYVLWRYPALSETFIRREVHALRQAGVPVWVFALEPDDPPAPPDPTAPAGEVVYFGPEETARGRACTRVFLARRPWTVVRLWLFIVRYRHPHTAWWKDRDVLYLAGQLASALETRAVTHVHTPWADSYAIVALVAARMLGLTYSVQARASEIHRTVHAPRLVDRLRFATFIITNTRYNERFLQTRLGAGAPPVHVVFNGIDLSRFCPPDRRGRRAGPLRLLSVGRLVEPKGFVYLLDACRLLLDQGLDLRCDIIGGAVEPGDTATWVQLRMRHTALRLEPFVHFLGARPFGDVLRALEEADIFVLPCVQGRDGSHDITPNAVIEAMALALPVVSTTSGGVPELIEHGKDGWLVAPGDSVALANAIASLAADGDFARTLGANARRTAEARFDVNRKAHRRVELFQSLRSQGASDAGRPGTQHPRDAGSS